VRNRAVGPEEDNMLKISGDGRRAALDLRLAGLPQDTPGKAHAAAQQIAAIWRAHRGDAYQAPDGTPYPLRGSLQLVFCDLGTPRPGWNVYDELRDQLASRGLPRESVRFVHEARTDRDKGQLFAACRSGRVAVLIGSTETMGTGVNVQDRAVALHHLDAPWRPADVAQREGRIIRQGNLNPEVQILRYVTAGSFDGYMWQTLERKAQFISQVIHGRLDTRDIADIGDTALSYSEVKALATGNPLLMDKAEADADLARLQRAERSHHRNQDALRHAITCHEQEITALTALTADIDAAIARRQDTRGDRFTMTIDQHLHTRRGDAGQHLKELLERELATVDGLRSRELRPGHLGGFPLTASIGRPTGKATVTISLDGAPGTSVQLTAQDLRNADPAGLITRLETRLARLEQRTVDALADIDHAGREIRHARDSIGQPFPQASRLASARTRARDIDKQLRQMAEPSPQPDPGATAAQADETAAQASHRSEKPVPEGCHPREPDQGDLQKARERSRPTDGPAIARKHAERSDVRDLRELDGPHTDPLPRFLEPDAGQALAPVAATIPDGATLADPFLAGRNWQAQGGPDVRREPEAELEAGG
jgi:Helicase conserved C-terminal domain